MILNDRNETNFDEQLIAACEKAVQRGRDAKAAETALFELIFARTVTKAELDRLDQSDPNYNSTLALRIAALGQLTALHHGVFDSIGVGLVYQQWRHSLLLDLCRQAIKSTSYSAQLQDVIKIIRERAINEEFGFANIAEVSSLLARIASSLAAINDSSDMAMSRQQLAAVQLQRDIIELRRWSSDLPQELYDLIPYEFHQSTFG